jgi:hypothetical protein
MRKTLLVTAALSLLSVQAQARPHHSFHHYRSYRQTFAMGTNMGTGMGTNMAATTGGERVVGGRPAGCPNAFCGCEASLYKFGRIVPGLNLASNWRRFPRAAPAPGMAAVRSGHVMILESQVGGNVWTVHDGNSGGHMTREHARSLAGYTIVDPNGGGGALASNGPGFGSNGSANAGFASPRYANANYGNSGFTNTSFGDASFTNSPQASYRHAWRSRRMARATSSYAMMR